MTFARLRFPLACIVAYLFWAWGAFYEFIVSGGDKIAGNFGDNRLCIFLLEHWFRVFQGLETWSSPRFFAPVRGVLGYCDTLFLNSLPYSIFRILGLDNYLAFESTLIAYNLAGYLGMLALLRWHLKVNRLLAITGALLFAFSNNSYLWVLSAQVYSVMLLPAMLVLLLKSIELIRRGERALAPALSFSILLGLQFFSTFYVAWFFVLFLLVALLIYVLFQHDRLKEWVLLVRRNGRLLAACTFSFLLSLAPFIFIYGPVLRSGRQRDFSEVLANMLTYPELLNVGSGNFLWGRILALSGSTPFSYGLPWFLFLAFLGSTVLAAWRLRQRPVGIDDLERMQLACGMAVAVVAALLFKYNEVAPWQWVWMAVPGAKAIRVVPRFMLVLNLFVVLVAILGIQRVWDQAKLISPARSGLRTFTRALIAGFAVLFLLEQVNTAQVHDISRSAEKARLHRLGHPPANCRTTFIVEDEKSPLHPVALHVDMMLVAQRYGLATINGYSGFNPPGWNLYMPKGQAYYRWVEEWLSSTGLVQGACAADIAGGVWKQVAYSDGIAAAERSPGRFYFPPSLVKIEPRMARPFDSLAAMERFHTVVGVKNGTTISSTGKGGYLQYGPYSPAAKGAYVTRWFGTIHQCQDAQLGYVEINTDEHLLLRKRIPCPATSGADAPLAELQFQLTQDVKALQCSFLVERSQLSISRILIQPAQ